jgi:hypothetical protein
MRRLLLALALPAACGGQEKPAPPAPAAPPEAPSTFKLPEDLVALLNEAKLEISGVDHKHLRLQISEARRAIRVEVPAGVVARAVDAPDAGEYIVRAPAVFDRAGGSLHVVSGDFDRFRAPDRVRFELAPAGDDAVTRFLLEADRRKASWGAAQAGVFAMRRNPPLAELRKLRVPFKSNIQYYDMNTGRFVPNEHGIAGYAELKELRTVLGAMREDPSRFQLVRDARAQLDAALKAAEFEPPALNWESMIVNGGLEPFSGEPEVEALLLRYVTTHPRHDIRERALKSLAKAGLIGASESSGSGSSPRMARRSTPAGSGRSGGRSSRSGPLTRPACGAPSTS